MKQIVITTLEQLRGSSLNFRFFILFFSISITFISCKPSIRSFAKYNYFNGGDLYNDSLKLNVSFTGDIAFYSPKRKTIKNEIQGLKELKYKNLLVSGKTFVSPLYNVLLFYNNKEKKHGSYDTVVDTLLLSGLDSKRVLYKKKIKNKSIYLYLSALGNHKSNITLLQDGKSMIETVRFDGDKKKALSYMDIFNTYKDEDNYLYVMNKFDEAPIEGNDWMKFQLLVTVLSNDAEYGRYNEMIDRYDSPRSKRLSEYIDQNIDKISAGQDALTKIKRIADNQKVVMLNEMHWHPKHRILAHKLLKPLKESGYTYLAVEALDKGVDSLLNKRTFPIKTAGYYTNEPYFGILIREALKLGYKIVSYDDFSSGDREQAQAKNLKKIIDEDPEAKVFVYAGIDHILEHNPPKKRMAEYFKEYTGIDPLTIDQVEIVGDAGHEVALIETGYFKNIEKIKTNVDFFVINNIKPSLTQLYDASQLSSYCIKENIINRHKNEELLISVYFLDEYKRFKSSSVPILNRITTINNDSVHLTLPLGNYHLKIRDVKNNLILEKQITIPQNITKSTN
ncbi:hypothetical protein [Leptobacterium sp. I13]|uniref:hypothetical protein n=1 Tax=Leptobacterium meishanense TaxID=3128904 RepID=UPI0030EDF81B